MNRWLDVATAIFAFIAAGFWFSSAAFQLPPIVTYWGQAPDIDPFYQAMKFSALMNMIAAVCSGVSAALFAIKLCLIHYARRRRTISAKQNYCGTTVTKPPV